MISPAEAARELQRRRTARASLFDSTRYTFGRGYRGDPVHRLIADTLDRVIAGELRRVMIWAPPQHGKSELTSVRLPAVWLGKRKDDPVILTSYGATLAEDFSRLARGVVESEEYRKLYPKTRTDPSSRRVGHWQIDGARGFVKAAGVGGPILGHGAPLGIIDDPFESWAHAQSQTQRDHVESWYNGTFRSRIHEGGAIVYAASRMHEDDLAGRLIARDPDLWHILRLPAIAETQDERDEAAEAMGLKKGQPDPLGRLPGEALAPSRFSAPGLEEIRREVGPLAWPGPYQCFPRAPAGNWIQRSWYRIVDEVPVVGSRVRYWDLAGTPGGGSWTVGTLVCLAANNMLHIEDVARGQWGDLQRDQEIRLATELDAQRYGRGSVKTWIEQEPGQSGKTQIQGYIRELAGHSVQGDRVTGSKDVRLSPFIAYSSAGNVVIKRAAWNVDWLNELASVRQGSTLRDQADSVAGAWSKVRPLSTTTRSKSPTADYRG